MINKNAQLLWIIAGSNVFNFERYIHLLTRALKIEEPDIIQKAGLIQFFKMTFELAWNTMKDYLQEQGFTDINTPRAAIKKGF